MGGVRKLQDAFFLESKLQDAFSSSFVRGGRFSGRQRSNVSTQPRMIMLGWRSSWLVLRAFLVLHLAMPQLWCHYLKP